MAGVGAVCGLIVAVVIFAPAAWLAAALAVASATQVQLLDPQGSVWRGDAQLVLSGGVGSTDALALPGRVAWELDPVLHGLRLRLRAGCCTPAPLETTLVPAWSGVTLVVADAVSHWPAGLLAGLGAPWNTLQAQGQLDLRSEGLSVEWTEGRIRLVGSAQLEALGVSSSLSTLKPLGSYRLLLAGSTGQGAPVLQLQTLEGSLSLGGSGQWNGARWSFRGEASATPQDEPVLGNLLNMVGRRQGARSLIALGQG